MREMVVEGIRKQIGGNEILKGVSLELRAGEVIALLGQSGSGKTTILRSVAGLEIPDSGRILLRDRLVFDANTGINVPPEKRGLGLVFQSYALWPNRTLFDNVAYGLKLRRATQPEIRKKVSVTLERLGLSGLEERYPHQLSGGQQQRVALARALVYEPSILLLDEPLSNLDAKLREEARVWLRELIMQTQISALYVTHDQVEAMAVADRLVLLHAGTIDQEGSPQEIYGRPATALAANFMGSNNQLAGTMSEVNNGYGRLQFQEGSLLGRVIGHLEQGAPAKAFIRIERLHVADGPGDNRLLLTHQTSLYLGERWEHVFAKGSLRLRTWGSQPVEKGDHWLEFAPDDLWLFD